MAKRYLLRHLGVDPVRDDEYGLSQARGGENNTHPRMYEQGAACAHRAVDIWDSAWAILPTETSVGKGLIDIVNGYCINK